MSLVVFCVLQMIVCMNIYTGSAHMLNNLSGGHFNQCATVFFVHALLSTGYKEGGVLTV